MLGKRRMALAVALSFSCYLRPIEAMSLVGQSIVLAVPAAGAGYLVMGLVLHETCLGIPGKTGAFDDTVLVDDVWLWTPLRALRAASAPLGSLWDFSPEDYRDAFVSVAMALGLGPFKPHPYQLRHGGASEDLASKRRTETEVMRRGRWTTTASLKRYAKETKLLHVVNQVPKDVYRFGQFVLANFSKVLEFGVGSGANQSRAPDSLTHRITPVLVATKTS